MKLVRLALGGLPLLVTLSFTAASCELVAGVQDTVLAVCEPGEKRDCYTGPEGTEGIGICKPGTQACKEDASGFGACEGEVLAAKEDCSNALDDTCSGAACGEAMWTKSFDVGGDNETQLMMGLGVDSKGNIYLAGHFTGSAQFGGDPLMSQDPRALYVTKLDPDGNTLWSKAFGQGDIQKTVALQVTPDDQVIVATDPGGGTVDFGAGDWPGGTVGTVVARLDGDGNTVWVRYLEPRTGLRGLGVDPKSGDIVLAGGFSGTTSIGSGFPLTSQNGSEDIFVAKLAPSGETTWAKAFGDSDPAQAESQSAWAVAVGETGLIAVIGPLRGVLTDGMIDVSAQGGAGLFALALDTTGGPLWLNGYGDMETTQVIPFTVAVGSDGSVVAGGGFTGRVAFGGFSNATDPGDPGNLFVVRWNDKGHQMWTRAAGDIQPQQTFDVAVDPLGNVFAVGAFVGSIDLGTGTLTSAGDGDVFIAGYAANGEVLWTRGRGSSAPYQFASAVAIDPDGNLIVAGPNDGTLDLGSGAITPKNIDPFVAKIPPR